MRLNDIWKTTQKMVGYSILHGACRLDPYFPNAGPFTDYQGKMFASVHMIDAKTACIVPAQWSETSWVHARFCKIVSVYSVPNELYFLLTDREGFKQTATGCVRCNEAEGTHLNSIGLYCDACEDRRQEELRQDKENQLYTEEYERVLRERGRTPRGIVAACFQVPWGELREQEYDGGAYLTSTTSGHTWRVPFKTWHDAKHIFVHIMEIDRDLKPVATHVVNIVDDVNNALHAYSDYVTEMEKPKSLWYRLLSDL